MFLKVLCKTSLNFQYDFIFAVIVNLGIIKL